jgi:hypothetical protein
VEKQAGSRDTPLSGFFYCQKNSLGGLYGTIKCSFSRGKLGISPCTLRRLVKSGKIPYRKVGGRSVFCKRIFSVFYKVAWFQKQITKKPPMFKKEKSPIRGTLTMAEKGYSGDIPVAAFNALEGEVSGLMHGTVTLSLHIKDGHLTRFVISRERSFIPGKPMTGSHNE